MAIHKGKDIVGLDSAGNFHAEPFAAIKKEASHIKSGNDIERIKGIIEDRKNRRLKRAKLVKPPFEPRYDEVYEKGVEWLDSL